MIMNRTPLISVVMPVYNESIHNLHDSINSILNQTYKNFEYIIVDDNPANNSIKNYIKKRAQQDSRIRLVFNQHNLKLTKSENKGIRLAKGKYIARIDADDVAYKNRLSNQLIFCIKNDLDISSSNISLINDNDQVTRKSTFHTTNIINQRKVKKIMEYGNIAVGPTFFFNKNIYYKIGKYRNFNGEDYDLVARFLIKGYTYGFQSDPLIYKRLRRSSITYHGTLAQYMAERMISQYLRRFDYKKIMPLNLLFRKINNINKGKRNHFRRYANARYTYNDHKTFANLLKTILSILSSKIVFQRCLWSLFNKYKLKH